MRPIILGLVGFLVCGSGAAEMLVVLDMDGELGDGPDSVFVEPQDSVTVAVWLVGDQLGTDFYAFSVFVVDNGTLGFMGGEILIPPPWVSDPLSEVVDTVAIVAMDPTLGGSPEGTFLVAILQYVTAEEETLGELGIDLARSGFAVDFGPSYYFDGFIGGSVVIGTTATDATSWGAIKTLFR